MFNRKILSQILKKSWARCMSEFSNVINEAIHFKTPIPKKFQYSPLPLYGGKYTVTALPGSGIGNELMNHIQDVLQEACVGINFEKISSPKPNESKEIEDKELFNIKTSIQRNRVALKGCPVADQEALAMSQLNLNIKAELDLYISIVHFKPYPNVKCLNPNFDIILARQNTEGEYLMLEHETVKGNVEALKVVTREKTELFAKWAFKYAKAHRRRKVTVVHKKDVYAYADGLFVDTIKEQARDYRELKFETMRLTPFIEKLMRRPQVLDFVMIPNLYGSIATNIACGLLGGPGLLSKKSYSNYYAVFEPAVGTLSKDLDGKNIVNPVAMLNSVRDMLAYLKMDKDANAIDCAIKKTLCIDRIQTPDIGGNATTEEFIERVKYYAKNMNRN